ncbi:hypothetical protein XENOCAPTIV_030684 [Xenoophorus captivus]|uniref:Uncharacterized protein n=1 Tax=Xenoophorus captivus TaxID=1517983 RepID=A0ABV0RMS8_9TELE
MHTNKEYNQNERVWFRRLVLYTQCTFCISTQGSLAFVPQQAWIQNATLRDNILFGSPYEDRRFQDIIEACALGPDLKLLSAGDLTEIGEKTRILVTHGVSFLPYVDEVVVLVNGQISEIGSYQSLRASKGAFSEFLDTYAKEQSNQTMYSLVDIQVKFSVYLQFLRAMGWGYTFWIFAIYFIQNVAFIGQNLWLSDWTNDAVVYQNETYPSWKRDTRVGVFGALGLAQGKCTFLL